MSVYLVDHWGLLLLVGGDHRSQRCSTASTAAIAADEIIPLVSKVPSAVMITGHLQVSIFR